jgi:hypothetical protein
LPMRDDSVEPKDRDDTGTPASGRPAPGAIQRTIQPSDGTRPDAPAPLSAIPHLADLEAAGLTDEEIALYRRRVAEGFYNSPEVADEVARRMMKRGDI